MLGMKMFSIFFLLLVPNLYFWRLFQLRLTAQDFEWKEKMFLLLAEMVAWKRSLAEGAEILHTDLYPVDIVTEYVGDKYIFKCFISWGMCFVGCKYLIHVLIKNEPSWLMSLLSVN